MSDGTSGKVFREVTWAKGEGGLPIRLTVSICTWLAMGVDVVGAALSLGPCERVLGGWEGLAPYGTSGASFFPLLQSWWVDHMAAWGVN